MASKANRQPAFVLVGGFLGAGKTTLLRTAAEHLTKGGARVGLITNDQAAGLADTERLRAAGFEVSEIAGGCFCCRYPDLLAAADHLCEAVRPDVILAEAVGSCVDLVATVLRPLERIDSDLFVVAPFTVLIDPERLRELLSDRSPFPDEVAYIYRKQLEEADILAINKSDLLDTEELAELKTMAAAAFPGRTILGISAQCGEGVAPWLNRVRKERRTDRATIEVDYDRYATGEAALGWLNASAQLTPSVVVDWREFVEGFVANLCRGLERERGVIAHVKLFLTLPGASLAASIVRDGQAPWLSGHASPSKAEAALVLNVRVGLPPKTLRATVEHALAAACGDTITLHVQRLDCFSPARPVPTHRLTEKA